MGFFNNITGTNIYSDSINSTNCILNNITGNLGYFTSITGINIITTNNNTINNNTNNITGNIGYSNMSTGINLSYSNIYCNSITGNTATFSNFIGFSSTGYTGPTGFTGVTGVTGPTGDFLFIGMKSYNTTNQTIPNNAATSITNWTTIFDTNNGFDATTGKYTIPVSGYYMTQAMLTYSNTGNWSAYTGSEVQLYYNTSTLLQNGIFFNWEISTGHFSNPFCNSVNNFNQGDTLEIKGFQKSSVSLDLITLDNTYNIFSIEFLGNPTSSISITGITGPTGPTGNINTNININNNNVFNATNINTTNITGNISYFNTYTGTNFRLTNNYANNITGSVSKFQTYTGSNINITNVNTTNLFTNGVSNIVENITGTATLSTYQNSIFYPSTGNYAVTLPNATVDQIKTVRLLNRYSNNVTISCSKGSFDLTPLEPQKTLHYMSNGWEIYEPNTILTSDSFYPTTQEQYMTGSFGLNGGGFDVDISSDGNTAISCNTGSTVSIGTRTNGTWSLQSNLTPSNYIGTTFNAYNVTISSDGNTAIFSSDTDNSNTGAAWIFTRNSNVWTQQTKLIGTASSSSQQKIVASNCNASIVAVGGPNDNTNQGAVWMYANTGIGWTEQTKLIAIGNTGAAAQGSSIALSSDGYTLAIGGPTDSASTGAVWIFSSTGNTIWTQQAKLTGTGSIGPSLQGSSIDLSADGNTLAIGGPGDNSNFGATWIFNRTNGNVWTQQTKLIGSGNTGSIGQQGTCVSLSDDGNTLAVGAPFDNTIGSVWIFKRYGGSFGGNWVQQIKLSSLNNTPLSSAVNFGQSLAFNSYANTLLIGGNKDYSATGSLWSFI